MGVGDIFPGCSKRIKKGKMTFSHRFKFLEYFYHFLMLFFLTGALIPLIVKTNGTEVDPYAGDPLTQTILIIGYCLMLPYLYVYRRRMIHYIYKTFWVWIFVLLVFLSCFWSAVPLISLRKSISLFLLFMYGLILVMRFSLSEYLKLLGNVLLVILVCSLLLVIYLPSFGIMHDQGLSGAWSGIFSHKHFLGFVCNLALIIFLYLISTDHKQWKICWFGGIVLSLLLTVGSRSVEAVVGEIITLSSIPLIYLFQQRRWAIPIAISLFLGVGGFLSINYLNILSILGKSPTLTGRTPIWVGAITLGLQKPWFGYGYKAFWLDKSGAVLTLIDLIGMNPGHSHNGYIDLFLDLGIFGFVLAIIIFGGAFIKIIRAMSLEKKFTPELVTALLLLINLAILNLVENHLFEPNQLSTMFFLQLSFFGSMQLKNAIQGHPVDIESNSLVQGKSIH